MDTNQLEEKSILHSILFAKHELLSEIEFGDSLATYIPFSQENSKLKGMPLPLSIEEATNNKEVLPCYSNDLIKCINDSAPNQQPKRHNMELICPHKDKKHYAKNMCINCYHKFGRDKKAWLCPHKDLPHYAHGECQNCYLSHYHQVSI